MVYLIDPDSLNSKGGNGCEIVCKLCNTLCPRDFVPLYGVITPA